MFTVSDQAEQELNKCSLANLYNQRPTWLANLHRDLDAAELRPAIIAIAYAAAACAALGTAVFTAYSLRILRKWKQHDD